MVCDITLFLLDLSNKENFVVHVSTRNFETLFNLTLFSISPQTFRRGFLASDIKGLNLVF